MAQGVNHKVFGQLECRPRLLVQVIDRSNQVSLSVPIRKYERCDSVLATPQHGCCPVRQWDVTANPEGRSCPRVKPRARSYPSDLPRLRLRGWPRLRTRAI